MDTGRLGILTIEIAGDREASQFLAALATGNLDRFAGFHSWASATFEVTSGAPIDVGLDGETLSMDPPLRFTIRPSALRVRLPTHAIGYSPAAIEMGFADSARALWRTVLGQPVAIRV